MIRLFIFVSLLFSRQGRTTVVSSCAAEKATEIKVKGENTNCDVIALFEKKRRTL